MLRGNIRHFGKRFHTCGSIDNSGNNRRGGGYDFANTDYKVSGTSYRQSFVENLFYAISGGAKKIDIQVVLTQQSKNKSILGKNRFFFELTPKGLLPEGLNDERNVFKNCDPTFTNSTAAGRGCTAWVVYNKNMDYLHCRDKLDWNGKHSCK